MELKRRRRTQQKGRKYPRIVYGPVKDYWEDICLEVVSIKERDYPLRLPLSWSSDSFVCDCTLRLRRSGQWVVCSSLSSDHLPPLTYWTVFRRPANNFESGHPLTLPYDRLPLRDHPHYVVHKLFISLLSLIPLLLELIQNDTYKLRNLLFITFRLFLINL